MNKKFKKNIYLPFFLVVAFIALVITYSNWMHWGYNPEKVTSVKNEIIMDIKGSLIHNLVSEYYKECREIPADSSLFIRGSKLNNEVPCKTKLVANSEEDVLDHNGEPYQLLLLNENEKLGVLYEIFVRGEEKYSSGLRKKHIIYKATKTND